MNFLEVSEIITIFANAKLKIMANTKNYSLREKIIDYYLSRGWYSRQQIEDACNRELEAHGEFAISSRQTIFNDFLSIKSKYRVTIETKKCGRTTYYRYQRRGFSIYKSELSYEDFSHLKEALQVLKHFRGMPQFEWVDELSVRLNLGLRSTTDNRNLVAFEDASSNTGMEFFTPLYNAINEKITLSVDYKSFKRPESKVFEVSPYHLKEYNNRWFLLGKSPGYDKISVYALDRIVSIRNAGFKYEDTDIDFDDYFENVIGVTVSDNPVETVELWISKQQLSYVETKPLHRSQRLLSTDDTGGVFQFDLIPNYELEQTILAFGEHAKVLAPASLRARIRQRLCDELKNYGYVQIPWTE